MGQLSVGQDGEILGVPIPVRALAVEHALASHARLTPPRGYDYAPALPKSVDGMPSEPQVEIDAVLARLLRDLRHRDDADSLEPETQNKHSELASLDGNSCRRLGVLVKRRSNDGALLSANRRSCEVVHYRTTAVGVVGWMLMHMAG